MGKPGKTNEMKEPFMPALLEDQKIAFLAADEGVEQVELTKPWSAIENAGGEAVLVSPEEGKVQAFHHLDRADEFDVDVTSRKADVNDYSALVLPGGVANPDKLRMDSDSVEFAGAFFGAGKPVAVICHGPWTLVEAGVLGGRTITSFPSLRTDIENAGGKWIDQEVVVCEQGSNQLISSRRPDDLPAFNETLTTVVGGQ